MKKFTQNLISIISVLIILGFIAYGIFWVFMAQQMTKALTNLWSHQEQYLITLNAEQPSVTGFPAPPKIAFSGSLTDRNGILYTSPSFIYQGFVVPTQAITLKAPEGIDISGPIFKAAIHLDDFLLKVRIPTDFPQKFDQPTLTAWQKRGGSLPIENVRIIRGSVALEGEGYLNLDDGLQPSGVMTVKITGLDDLLNELVQNGTIGAKQALMGQSLINLMSQKNATTGINSLNTRLTFQRGGIFLGPMRVAYLPEWKWDKN